MNYYVYILKLADGSFYVGYTKGLKSRIDRHNQKQCKTTKDNLPAKLIWYSVFLNKKKAQSFERYLKSGSGTAFRNKRLI
jgi:putative endonuclease